MAQGLLNSVFTYDPSAQGAITSIAASVSKELILSIPGPFRSAFHPTIFQDGTYYIASIDDPNTYIGPITTGYVPLSQSGLTATDFLSFDFLTGSFGGANPNFDGDPIILGLTQMGTINNAAGQNIANYQTLSFTIATAVPEPCSLALLGAGLLSFVALAACKSLPASTSGRYSSN